MNFLSGLQTYNSGYSSVVSDPTPRSSFWNVIELGDHYDIRKSTIAKLPGSNAKMSEHLDIVCLLQGAQIERLTEGLQTYRLKFKEVSRKELDRHSYQVQIRELTERLSQSNLEASESRKLKQYIKRLTNEQEELKGNRFEQEKLIREQQRGTIQSLNIRIQSMTAETQSMRQQFMVERNKVEAIQKAKDQQMADMTKVVNQNKLASESQQVSMKNYYEYEFTRIDSQFRALENSYDFKCKEYEDIKVRAIRMQEKMRGLQTNTSSVQVEQRINRMNFQAEQLRLQVHGITSKLQLQIAQTEQAHMMHEQVQQSYRILKSDYETIKTQFNSLRQQTRQQQQIRHQQQIRQQVQTKQQVNYIQSGQAQNEQQIEIESLRIQLRQQIESHQKTRVELLRLSHEIHRLINVQQESKNLRLQIQQLSTTRRYEDSETQSANHRLNHVESIEIAQTKMENTQLKDELGRLREDNQHMLLELNNYKVSLENIKTHYDMQINSIFSQYEERLTNMQRSVVTTTENSTNFQSQNLQIQQMDQQIQRLNNIIANKDTLYNQNAQFSVKRLEEATRQVAEFETEYSHLKSEWEQTNQRLVVLQNNQYNLQRYCSELEEKIQVLEQVNSGNFQSMDQNLRARNFDLAKAEEQLRLITRQRDYLNQQHQRIYKDLENQRTVLERQLKTLQDENTYLKDTLNNVNAEHIRSEQTANSKLDFQGQNIERLNLNLRNKVEELAMTQRKAEAYLKEIDRLKRDYAECVNKSEQEVQRVSVQIQQEERMRSMEISSKIEQINQETQALARQKDKVRQEFERANKEVYQLRVDNQRLGTELDKAKKEMQSLRFQFDSMRLELTRKQNELERLVLEDNKKRQDLDQTRREFERMRLELENYRLASEKGKTATSAMSVELKNANTKIAQYQNSIAMLSLQVERLNSNCLSRGIELQKSQETVTQLNLVLKNFHHQSSTDLKRLESECKNAVFAKENIQKTYEKSAVVLTEQFEKLQQIIQQLRSEKTSLSQKNKSLGAEYDKLSVSYSSLEKQSFELKLKFADYSSLHKRVEQQMGLMVVLFAEVESLRRQKDALVEKQKQATIKETSKLRCQLLRPNHNTSDILQSEQQQSL